MKRLRKYLAAAMTAAVLCASAACGSSVGASDVPVVPADGDVTIRLDWWGGDARIKATEQAVAAFEKRHSNIHVDTEYADWTGYWDKLAVQSAGGNAPDVMQMDELYLAFYGSMGSLLDLDKASKYLDLDGMDASLKRMGQVEGRQVAVPMTTTQYGVIVNNDVLDGLGLTLPDTSRWTWDEFADFAKQVTERSGGKDIGAIAPNNGYGLQLWARQHGESLFEGNRVAIAPETLASFLELPAEWAHDGVEGSAERWSENTTAAMNDSDFGKGRQAMMLTQTTQITPYAQAAGTTNMTLVPLPQVDSHVKSMYLKPGMYWAISSQSQHPAEAAMLVDYLVNSKEAGRILGTERGIPANNAIRKDLAAQATGTDRTAFDFVDGVRSTLGEPPAITPNGASELDKTIVRYQQDVVFGKRKPLDAAKAMIAELQESIDFNS
ncbi:ABC transporter substrate-binding protein [Bifidobacterium saguinibicoloris]|uniref:ABC transporter substrate-binding protein n=1 Tax=Bifidobacterium saguinibicoloris TaxID=2834433 RepID=UPI001C5662A4|nr:extracellular solute-binding protein [Bifidobacterium saguinibicoloris]MBW3080541.1 extracellular solute-binding protein [Bifidobacterium saguinibicoloris]